MPGRRALMQRPVFYGWLTRDPLVLYESVVPYDPLQLHPWLPPEPVLRLLKPVWRLAPDDAIAAHARIRADRPHDAICFLCAEDDLLDGLRAAGIAAIRCNHNAFLDERIFTPDAAPAKRFDAVYNARMAPWKRHALACEVESLLLIGDVQVPGEDSAQYADFLRMLMPDAAVLPAPGQGRLSAHEVARAVAGARVGLCLSAREGAMYACGEYLLSGLAVVSTPSEGGRESWFEPWFARIVAPEPVAIAAAVRDLVRAPPPPQAVREATLARARADRERMLEVVDQWLVRSGSARRYSEEFAALFVNKLGAWRAREDLMRHLASDLAGGPR